MSVSWELISLPSINSSSIHTDQTTVNKHVKTGKGRIPIAKHKHTLPPLSHTHTEASDLSACQHTKRSLCPLITLVQPPLQEAVSLTGLAHGRSSVLGGREQNNALSPGGGLFTQGPLMKSVPRQPFSTSNNPLSFLHLLC